MSSRKVFVLCTPRFESWRARSYFGMITPVKLFIFSLDLKVSKASRDPDIPQDRIVLTVWKVLFLLYLSRNVAEKGRKVAAPLLDIMVDVDAVQRTWALVATSDDAIDAAGKAFFSKIFEIAPGAIELFTSFKDVPEETRYESPGFVRHARSVMTTVGVAVQGLRDLDALVPVLEKLGARHLGYGVQEAHYDVVGEALLKTLESALGDEWTPAVREAWTQTYGVVKTTMIRGATEFARKNLDA